MVIMRELDCQNPSTRQFCEMNVLDNNGDSCNTEQFSRERFSPSNNSTLETFVKVERTDPAFAKESNVANCTDHEPLHNKKCGSRKNAWGNLSYAELITKAIESSSDKRLTLAQIYDWMVRFVPYFRDKGDRNSSAGWKNSIRHNLSLHSRFKRIQNEGTGKSSWWTLNPDENVKKPARRRVLAIESKSLEKKWRNHSKKKISSNLNLVNKKSQSARAHIFDSEYQEKREFFNNSNLRSESSGNHLSVNNAVSCNVETNDSSGYVLENCSPHANEWKIYYENQPGYLCYAPNNMLVANNAEGSLSYDAIEKRTLNLDAFYAMPVMTTNGYHTQYSSCSNDTPVLADLSSISSTNELLNIGMNSSIDSEYHGNYFDVLKESCRSNELTKPCLNAHIINNVSDEMSPCHIKQLLPIKRHCAGSDDCAFGFTELHLSNMMPLNSESTPQNVITLPNGSTLQSLNSSVNCLTPLSFSTEYNHNHFPLPVETTLHATDSSDNVLRHHYAICAHPDVDKSENIVRTMLKKHDNGNFDGFKAFHASQALKHART